MDRGAELARARTFSVSTSNNNPIVELLGQDTDRRYTVIMTLDEPVVISFSQQAADDPRNAVNAAGLSANGFVIPARRPGPGQLHGCHLLHRHLEHGDPRISDGVLLHRGRPMKTVVNTSHGCASGGGAAGAIPVLQKASSSCCGAVLAEGGTEAAGYACTGCGQPASRVMSDPVAHWTCLCGQRRQQVITIPQDDGNG